MKPGSGVARSPTVLVVDADPVSRRFVELALKGFTVEFVNDAAAALEVLRSQVIDLIVSETMLSDMNGLRFYRHLREEMRLRSIPFVFLSSDSRIDTKVVALHAGVDDYLSKPCNAGEFLARTKSLMRRRLRATQEKWNRSYTLAGDFTAMAFPDLVASIDMGSRTGILSVLIEGRGGQVFFEKGHPVHAIYGNLTGAQAFYRFVWATEGQFEFRTEALTLTDKERTIVESVTGLIMEAARLADTARFRGSRYPKSENMMAAPDPSTPVPTDVRAAGPSANKTLASQYELAISDPFALGDLKLLNEADLAQWTTHAVGRDRLHMILIASPVEATCAMLPLAASLTEQTILDGLNPGRKALALAFFLRDERLLDLVLLDAQDPSPFLPTLRRVPSVVIIAPPHGDFMAFGTQCCAILAPLLTALNPNVIMGVGLPTLESALARIGIRSSNSRVVRCYHALLGDPSCELRHLLIQALRLWTSSGTPQPDDNKRGASR